MKKLNNKLSILSFALLAVTLHAENNNRPQGGGGGAAAGGTRALRVSEYMMAPTATWAQVPASPIVTEEKTAAGDLGFRVIHLKAADKASKRAAVELASTGLVQAGDIFLSFRPEWDGTLAYAHMQLGISHAALAFVVDEGGSKFVHTIETPINYSSPMNSSHHYGDLNAIHIIRPSLSQTQRTNLSKWARKILANPSRMGFFSDYGTPWYARAAGRKPIDQIKELGKVATQGGTFNAYCSEFVWTLLGLRDCDPGNYRVGSNCEKPIYGNANGAMDALIPGLLGDSGLVQGPEAALLNAGKPQAARNATLKDVVFKDILRDPDQLAGRMSSGHRAVAEANSGLMTTIANNYYGGGEPAQLAAGINAQVTDNFSPTSFMVRSNAKLDGFQYVGTVVFDR